ncbi:S8 family serine peptidase [Actinoplanes sp. CA-015351]|uniref:S8 family serine peptidase n=1 Tax=Actinoplanes sp. CA-015351 TaxID=3239897 RepID=UPI003D998253
MTGAITTIATPAAAASKALPFTIGVKPGTDPDKLLKSLGFELNGGTEWIPGLDAVRADLEYDDFSALMNKVDAAVPEHFRYAQREQVLGLHTSEQAPLTGRELQTVQLPRGKSGSDPVTVAVLDTGVTPNSDLPASRLVSGVDATRLPFVMLPEYPDMGEDSSDKDGYGTMAAGVIAGDSGVCPSCRIMPVKIAYQNGDRVLGFSAELAAGIVWAADHGAQVITTSASVSSNSQLIDEAVQYALDRDVLLVASAGKYAYSGSPVYPAATEPVLAVSAVDTSGRTTGRSNYESAGDRWIDVAAAEGAPATNHKGEKTYLNGVEGATAVVAGTAALALSSKPGATADDVRKAIVGTTSTPQRLPVLNAGKAVHAVAGDDAADPEITATGLTAGQLIAKPIDVQPTVTDDYGFALIEMTVAGKTTTIRNPWEKLRFTPPAGFSGDLAVSFRVTDFAGKTDGATTVVRVDTAGPTGIIVSPAANAHIRGAATVRFRGSADVASAKVNGVAMKKVSGEWTASVTPNRGQLVVEAADASGNITRFTRTVVVDNEGPTVTSISPAPNAKVRGTFTSSLSGAKDVSGVAKAELWANGKYLGAGTSRKVATGKASGNVKLTWKLTDKLGNTRTYTRTVIADNKAPTLSITKAPKNKAKVKGTVKVYVKATDTSGIARVELIVNGKVVAKDVKSGYVLSVNTKNQKKTMKVRVRAYDKLGNVTYTSIRTWYRK